MVKAPSLPGLEVAVIVPPSLSTIFLQNFQVDFIDKKTLKVEIYLKSLKPILGIISSILSRQIKVFCIEQSG